MPGAGVGFGFGGNRKSSDDDASEFGLPSCPNESPDMGELWLADDVDSGAVFPPNELAEEDELEPRLNGIASPGDDAPELAELGELDEFSASDGWPPALDVDDASELALELSDPCEPLCEPVGCPELGSVDGPPNAGLPVPGCEETLPIAGVLELLPPVLPTATEGSVLAGIEPEPAESEVPADVLVPPIAAIACRASPAVAPWGWMPTPLAGKAFSDPAGAVMPPPD